jgi:outer membrane murein-binding lipoprotein Lpp
MNASTIVSLRLGLSAAAAATLLLAGCGLAETTAVAATEAATAAEQAKKGKEMEEKVTRDIEAAEKAAAEARNNAEEAAQ